MPQFYIAYIRRKPYLCTANQPIITIMAKKTLYYYLSANYGILIDGKRQSNLWTALCSSDSERNPSGIPTMGFINKSARDFCRKEDYEFIEGSVSVLSIIKLTKAQYDALNDTKEPADEQEQ